MSVIDLTQLSVPQLTEIKKILDCGILAKAEEETKIETPVQDTPVVETTAEVNELKEKVSTLENEVGNKNTEIEGLQTKVSTVEAELLTTKEELTTLKEYKENAEKEAAKAELLKQRKEKVEELGLTIDLTTNADRWLSMSDEDFIFTLSQLGELKRTATSSKKESIPDTNIVENKTNFKDIVREGLKELKNKR